MVNGYSRDWSDGGCVININGRHLLHWNARHNAIEHMYNEKQDKLHMIHGGKQHSAEALGKEDAC